MFMNLQEANFEDLSRFYFFESPARNAVAQLHFMMKNNQDRQLRQVLRHHDEGSVDSPKEIDARAAVDRLMSCCGVMEIASLTGFVGDLPEDMFGFLPILENRHVRRFYEVKYPSRLPQLFRARLEGRNRASEKDPSNSCMLTFLELDRGFVENLEDRTFLRMLDSFQIGGFDFDDVMKLIEDPALFADHLLIAPEERDARSYALYEFGLFMEFSFGLKKLLELTASRPLLQSEIWSYYGYWFEIMGKQLRDNLDEALKRFLRWEPPEGSREEAHLQVQQYVSEARSTLNDLTSRKFVEPVERLLTELGRDERPA
jgi:hypothetical protein